jgi:hypothetical protein
MTCPAHAPVNQSYIGSYLAFVSGNNLQIQQRMSEQAAEFVSHLGVFSLLVHVRHILFGCKLHELTPQERVLTKMGSCSLTTTRAGLLYLGYVYMVASPIRCCFSLA